MESLVEKTGWLVGRLLFPALAYIFLVSEFSNISLRRSLAEIHIFPVTDHLRPPCMYLVSYELQNYAHETTNSLFYRSDSAKKRTTNKIDGATDNLITSSRP